MRLWPASTRICRVCIVGVRCHAFTRTWWRRAIALMTKGMGEAIMNRRVFVYRAHTLTGVIAFEIRRLGGGV